MEIGVRTGAVIIFAVVVSLFSYLESRKSVSCPKCGKMMKVVDPKIRGFGSVVIGVVSFIYFYIRSESVVDLVYSVLFVVVGGCIFVFMKQIRFECRDDRKSYVRDSNGVLKVSERW
ncbi:hypothetical protein N1030_11930 [Desulfovibrio mangrovi]|uniref:hypothetical protein n=1 Tax=Desulfovibrio mangrovi TaxID=2976983 RepID=UPI00224565A0|nr:hypothetical protein [Desulfovibrio mangrovi]UZP66322.1 hypothetical protein N1030_11930 [Desulfovibrio mangrovi]